MLFDVVSNTADPVDGMRVKLRRFMTTDLSVSVDRGQVATACLTSVLRIAAHIAPTNLYLKLCQVMDARGWP